jgi:hypothetical protein
MGMLPTGAGSAAKELSTKSVVIAVLFEMISTVFSNIVEKCKDFYGWASKDNINAWLDNMGRLIPMYGLTWLEKYGISKRLVVATSAIYLFVVTFYMREGYKLMLIFPAMRTI